MEGTALLYLSPVCWMSCDATFGAPLSSDHSLPRLLLECARISKSTARHGHLLGSHGDICGAEASPCRDDGPSTIAVSSFLTRRAIEQSYFAWLRVEVDVQELTGAMACYGVALHRDAEAHKTVPTARLSTTSAEASCFWCRRHMIGGHVFRS
eukprot:TRINITY_DN27161_c0_g1_i3.p1 TRINITY_DN27161_c0_g1~~TRINITY_DN27161_c0_g1_i3.p1  ORF type:complete len:153 (-),score=5.38 TRINITY_DN27161_c0_g1_i3:262-720(-)